MSRIVDFQDGFSSASEPDQGTVEASSLREFASDAAYVTFKGSAAVDSDIYYNTTTDTVRVYLAGAWQDMVDSTNNQTIGGDKTFSNDVTVTGDLTVNGTTTTVNSTTLDVTDANITINNGGNQASADDVSGITVEMSDATDASILYDKDAASRWKVGDVGSEVEVTDISTAQTLTNKTIDADNNTISNLAHGAEVDNPASGVHGVTGDVVGTSDSQVITAKDIDGGTASNTNGITLPKDTTTNLDALTDKQATVAYDTTLDEPVYNNGAGWNTFGSGVGAPEIAYISYEVAANTSGGSSSTAAWDTRPLNTENDPDGLVTLTSNQIQFAATGDYAIDIVAVTETGGGNSRARFQNVTGATTEIQGISMDNDSGVVSSANNICNGVITVSSTSDNYEVQTIMQTARTNGLGQPINLGGDEVYTTVKITKL